MKLLRKYLLSKITLLKFPKQPLSSEIIVLFVKTPVKGNPEGKPRRKGKPREPFAVASMISQPKG